jgi:3-keto-disaccharide hydrolase
MLRATAAGIAIVLAGFLLQSSPAQEKTEWVQLFNGKDLEGWRTNPKNPGNWSVIDGCIVGKGKAASHLFTVKDDYENFRYKFTAKISDKGNSGQYFRTAFGPKTYPDGYEAQINSTHSDPVRTGSLYNFVKIKDRLVEPDTWFTQEVIAEGPHIQILVNDKKVVDFVDQKNTFKKGCFAIQQHPPISGGPDSEVWVKKVEVIELPASK